MLQQTNDTWNTALNNTDFGLRKRRKADGSSLFLNNHAQLSTSVPSSPVGLRHRRPEEKKESKLKEILSRQPSISISSLQRLAIASGGLLSAQYRKICWPLLLGVDVDNIPPPPKLSVLKCHRDYEQVLLDVERSLSRFPPGMHEDKRLLLQDKLVVLILHVLVNHPELHYYQGYHDICVTILLTVGEDLAFAVVDKLSTSHLSDYMASTMDKTKVVMDYVFPILAKVNPKLEAYLQKAEVGTMFCISWIITWYGHVLKENHHIVRLYDFFIASHPLMPVYVAASIVLYRESELLRCPCDMASLHHTLSHLPKDLPFEQLIATACDIYLLYPPSQLIKDNKPAPTPTPQQQMQEHRRRFKERKHRQRRVIVKVIIVALFAVLAGYLLWRP
ncbi:TBC1 domain family member 20-like [Argonauta hians]